MELRSKDLVTKLLQEALRGGKRNQEEEGIWRNVEKPLREIWAKW